MACGDGGVGRRQKQAWVKIQKKPQNSKKGQGDFCKWEDEGGSGEITNTQNVVFILSLKAYMRYNMASELLIIFLN